MMLENFGLEKSAAKVEQAVAQILKEGKVRTYDLGGDSTTSQVGDAMVEKVKSFWIAVR